MALVNNYEVLDLAVNLEKNGILFYGKAAQKATDPALTKLLISLTEMEQQHERTFADLRSHLAAPQSPIDLADKEGVAAAYLDSLIRGNVVFDPNFDPAVWLDANPSAADVLQRAVSFEKDTVVFYTGIREVVLPVPASAGKIDQIIREEKGHIILLAGQLRKYVS